jgi:hypothetical protein
VNPACDHCGRIMQLNTAASNESVQQFLCYCSGSVRYKNVHRVTQINFKTGEKTVTQWPR